jgi:hypothetical protein
LKATGQSDPATAKKFATAMLECLEEAGTLTIYNVKAPNGQDRPCYLVDNEKLAEIRANLR